jgi:hypothetical protein
MPQRAPLSCACPGCLSCGGRCPNLTAGGRCPSCTGQARKFEPHDKVRKKIYNSARWRGLRRQVQAETAWCSVDGCLELWTDLDHEPPLRVLLEQGLDPFARKHVNPLCHSHHSAKTLEEIRARARGGD